MRSILSLAILFGVAAMIAEADEKKEKPKPKVDPRYTERVTLRRWNGQKDMDFFKDIMDVPAFRKVVKDETHIYIEFGQMVFPKSEIIDADGAVWEVKKCGDSTEYRDADGVYVAARATVTLKKKAPDKKDPQPKK